MPNPIVDLVQEEMRQFEQDRASYHDLFPAFHQAPVLYPVPFFGDIRHAEVLTMGLNPSWNEFAKERGWFPGVDASALTSRLLHYFDLPDPSPHKWFSKLAPAYLPIGRSYRRGVAHIDLLSCPTSWPSGMNDQQRQALCVLAESATARLQSVLDLSCMAKVIIVLDHTVNDGRGGQWSVWEKAVTHIPLFQNHSVGNGKTLPILRANGPDDLALLVEKRRDEIREYLSTGPRLCHANYG